MTREQLLDLLGLLEDDLIERAAQAEYRRPPYRKWAGLSAAACLCLVVASAGLMQLRGCGAGSAAGSGEGIAMDSNAAALDHGADAAPAPDTGVLQPLELDAADGVTVTRALALDVQELSAAQVTETYTLYNETATERTLSYRYPYEALLSAPLPEVSCDGADGAFTVTASAQPAAHQPDAPVQVYEARGGDGQTLRLEVSGDAQVIGFNLRAYGMEQDGTSFFEGTQPGAAVLAGSADVRLAQDAPPEAQLIRRTLPLSALVAERMQILFDKAELTPYQSEILTDAVSHAPAEYSLDECLQAAWTTPATLCLNGTLTLAPHQRVTLTIVRDQPLPLHRTQPFTADFTIEPAAALGIETVCTVTSVPSLQITADGSETDWELGLPLLLPPDQAALTLHIRQD